jgi:hypothetical protein
MDCAFLGGTERILDTNTMKDVEPPDVSSYARILGQKIKEVSRAPI